VVLYDQRTTLLLHQPRDLARQDADEFTDRFYARRKKATSVTGSENPFMGPLINQGAVENTLRFKRSQT